MERRFFQELHSPGLDRMVMDAEKGVSAAMTGMTESQSAFLAALLAVKTGKRVLLVASNDLRAGKLGNDLNQLLGTECRTLGAGELELTRGAASHESAWRRLETLSALRDTRVLCTSADALVQRMGSPANYYRNIIRLRTGDRFALDTLLDCLQRGGYEMRGMVEGKGQYARRGSILDVYPPEAAMPFRLEFFDDEVDSVRSFDCVSQRTEQRLEECVIGPACETLLDPSEAEAAANRMRTAIDRMDPERAEALTADLPLTNDTNQPEDSIFLPKHMAEAFRKSGKTSAERQAQWDRRIGDLRQEADTVASGRPFRRSRVWLPVLCPQTWLLTDWFDADLVLLLEPDQLRERARERQQGFARELESAMSRGEAVAEQGNLLADWEELTKTLQRRTVFACSEFLRGQGGLLLNDAIDLESRGVSNYRNRLRDLARDIGAWQKQGMTVQVLAGGVSRGERLRDNLQELGCSCECAAEPERKPGFCRILPYSMTAGFIWPEAGLAIVSDKDVFGSEYQRSAGRRIRGDKLSSFTDLSPGDFVVHEDHGVGIFEGVVRMEMGGANRDFLKIHYAGSDILYVPVDQLSRVQKYIGNPDDPPKPSVLGGKDWQNRKNRVRQGLKKLAFSLAELYAQRSQENGYAFPPDGPWQQEFNDQFPHELTPDQAQSIFEIEQDMESARNMDRLLCGDVGYGKTEVSMRAAFKAIMGGKQVALLAPTTVLAQQHFITAQKRFEGFGARVDVLSRFRTVKEQRAILADLAEGKIDLIIGTHRLLAKDVKFHNLGLLIVDEEQRFGVGHKETIKNMKRQVDVLTLTATPIPRTLHMSMVGIRDMSVLETPPQDRLPVQTHVVEYSDGLIRDAILRELSRGGQVYFLYNQVEHIDRMFEHLKQLVPEARIAVGHGQMREHALEDVMMDFYAGSYDVLLCSTIIESGLDVPTANTLIVYDADRFGLSQLYQIRGRVGRSARQAYAWFTVRPDKILSETAQKRLSAIREFTEFGSGFRIALRDLEIRGAGSILGTEQHGHLETVGYDMYCKLLEEALMEARGIPAETRPVETRVDLKVDAYLPADYVADSRQRMEMYKRIGTVVTREDRLEVEEEFLDRFGDLPEPVSTLLDVAQLRGLANRLGATQVVYREGGLVLRLNKSYAPDGTMLLRAMMATDKRLGITSIGGIDGLTFRARDLNMNKLLKEGVRVLENLVEALREEAPSEAERQS